MLSPPISPKAAIASVWTNSGCPASNNGTKAARVASDLFWRTVWIALTRSLTGSSLFCARMAGPVPPTMDGSQPLRRAIRNREARGMNEPKLELSPSPGDACKTTTCYMCACRCGIKVWLKDGAIR